MEHTGCSDQGVNKRSDEEWSDSGYILKVEPREFSEGLNVRRVGEKKKSRVTHELGAEQIER